MDNGVSILISYKVIDRSDAQEANTLVSDWLNLTQLMVSDPHSYLEVGSDLNFNIELIFILIQLNVISYLFAFQISNVLPEVANMGSVLWWSTPLKNKINM